jgi:hypothetical protein
MGAISNCGQHRASSLTGFGDAKPREWFVHRHLSKRFPAIAAFEYTVTVRSVGSLGTASKTLQALVTKTFDLTDAAITMRGNEADSSFTGNAFSVDGRDYDHVTQALTGGTTHYGLTVPTAALQTTVNSALSAQQQDNIVGTAVPGLTASIGIGTSLPSTSVTSLANALCAAAPLANQFTTALNGSYSPPAHATWGTRASPQVHCVTGVGTPGNMSVDINGNFSGVGVLVVKDSDLVINGAFHLDSTLAIFTETR